MIEGAICVRLCAFLFLKSVVIISYFYAGCLMQKMKLSLFLLCGVAFFCSQINAMVALEVDDEVLVQRLLKRGETSGRPDDADESIIRNRIKEYYDKTAILKDYYPDQDKYFGVDGVGSGSGGRGRGRGIWCH